MECGGEGGEEGEEEGGQLEEAQVVPGGGRVLPTEQLWRRRGVKMRARGRLRMT